MNDVPVLTGPATFSFAAPPPPDPAALRPGQALVRVLAGGICGSDLPYFRGTPYPYPLPAGSPAPPPGFPMHEIVGDVLAVAPGSPGTVAAGARVVGWATAFDGLADHVVTDCASVAPCPAEWEPELAVLIQPLACVLYTVERIGDVAGRRCAVLGLGPIGLLFCHVLKSRGASTVVGVDRIDRGDVAGAFGVDEFAWTTGERWAAGVAAGAAPEVVVEAVGHQVSTLRHALRAVAPGGTVFYFGVNDDPVYPLDMGLMLRKNLTLMSGGTLERPRMLAAAHDYLQRHPDLLRRSVTHRFTRPDVQRAYETAARPAPGQLKVVVSIAT